MHRNDSIITSILQVHKFKTYSKMKLISFLNASNLQDPILVNRNVSGIVIIIKYMAKDVLYSIKRRLYIYIYALQYDLQNVESK